MRGLAEGRLRLPLLAGLCACLCLALASCSSNGATGTQLAGYEIESAQATVDAVVAIQPGGTPEHFENGVTARQEGDFDANSYFTVLPHLSMEPGYVLDYVYDYTGMGGYPVIYARPSAEPPFASYEDYEQAAAGLGTGAGDRPDYLAHVQADGTAEGYFELAVLRVLAGQFYLIWHANYNDTRIVCGDEALEAAFAAAASSFDLGDLPGTVRKEASKADLRTMVEVLDDGTATVRLVTFTKWGGLEEIQYTVSRAFPHTTLDWTVRTLVEYDCGVRF